MPELIEIQFMCQEDYQNIEAVTYLGFFILAYKIMIQNLKRLNYILHIASHFIILILQFIELWQQSSNTLTT